MDNKNSVDEAVEIIHHTGVLPSMIDQDIVNTFRLHCEEPVTELELLRAIAKNVVSGFESDDLWIDGGYGSANLGDARDLAKVWERLFSSKSESE